MSMRTTAPGPTTGPKPPATVPEGTTEAAPVTAANTNRAEAQEMTATRELGLPPAQVAQVAAATPATPHTPSIVDTLLEKKRDYESMRQRAIDELLNTIGQAEQTFQQTKQRAREQLLELGWEDPDDAIPAYRRPTTYGRRGRPPGVKLHSAAPVGRPRTNVPVGSVPRVAKINKVIKGMEKVQCPSCGNMGHDARSHRAANLAAIAAGKRQAKR